MNQYRTTIKQELIKSISEVDLSGSKCVVSIEYNYPGYVIGWYFPGENPVFSLMFLDANIDTHEQLEFIFNESSEYDVLGYSCDYRFSYMGFLPELFQALGARNESGKFYRTPIGIGLSDAIKKCEKLLSDDKLKFFSDYEVMKEQFARTQVVTIERDLPGEAEVRVEKRIEGKKIAGIRCLLSCLHVYHGLFPVIKHFRGK